MKTIMAKSITGHTLVGYSCETFPMSGGNCFSVLAEDGGDYRVLNFGYENLEHLLEKGLKWPVKIAPLDAHRAVIQDERIKRLQVAVEKTAGCQVFHVQSTPVREVFRGKVVWEGIVESFSLVDHPTIARCYGWAYQDDKGETQFVTVLEKPPVTSPQTAVKAYVASLAR